MTDLVSFRPEIIRDVNSSDAPVVAKTIGWAERIYRLGFVRKAFILAVLALAWELYGRWLGNPLLFPTFGQTVEAFVGNIVNGIIPQRMLVSLQTLVIGYGIGIVLAALLTTLAIGSRIGADLLETLTSMFNPLPAIALLPLALLWFGLGTGSRWSPPSWCSAPRRAAAAWAGTSSRTATSSIPTRSSPASRWSC